MVLSFGGSLGARRINEVMTEVLIKSHREGGIQHIHATGSAGYRDVVSQLKAHGITSKDKNIQVHEYINDMARCMAAADLVISRCGR